jgi:hypothetical protein
LQRPLRDRGIGRGASYPEVRRTMKRYHDAAQEGIEIVGDRDTLDG